MPNVKCIDAFGSSSITNHRIYSTVTEQEARDYCYKKAIPYTPDMFYYIKNNQGAIGGYLKRRFVREDAAETQPQSKPQRLCECGAWSTGIPDGSPLHSTFGYSEDRKDKHCPARGTVVKEAEQDIVAQVRASKKSIFYRYSPPTP